MMPFVVVGAHFNGAVCEQCRQTVRENCEELKEPGLTLAGEVGQDLNVIEYWPLWRAASA